MKLQQQSTTKVLDPIRRIQFIDEIYHTDEKGRRQGRCERFRWFEAEDHLDGDRIKKKYPHLWSLGDPNRGRPAFVFVSERGTYKDDKEDGLWILLAKDGSIVSIDSYKAGERKGICMEHRYGQDYFYRIGEDGEEYSSVTQKEINAIRRQAQEMAQSINCCDSTWVSKTNTQVNLLGQSRSVSGR